VLDARKLAWMFALGGIGGALCDQIHVLFGVLSYRDPFFLGQGWWVAPNFGVATIVVFAAVLPIARLRARRAGKPSLGEIGFGAFFFLASYVATGVFDARPIALSLALAGAWVSRMVFGKMTLELAVFSVALGIAGPLYEIILTSTGAYTFRHPGVWSVPYWLPFLYMQTAPLAVQVGEVILP
jgi:hypothetical protein